MLGQQKIVAFGATKSASAARRFYEQTLGLEVQYEDDHAVVFDAHGTILRLQKVGDFEPQPFTTLGWKVADLIAVVDALSKRGVVFEHYHGMDQDERGIWAAPGGAHVAWFKDPDGNTLSLSEV